MDRTPVREADGESNAGQRIEESDAGPVSPGEGLAVAVSPGPVVVIVGLGNPGADYATMRHNVGFLVIDELARRWRVGTWEHRYHALVARRSGEPSITLVKPLTFMNRSGDAVAALVAAEGLVAAQLLVVVDDVELPLGRLRLRARGSAGTHNGLRSIVTAVGTSFPRLRLGVRGEGSWDDLADYVLAPFERGERARAEQMVLEAADCVEMALRVGIAQTASRFNRADPPAPGTQESGAGEPTP